MFHVLAALPDYARRPEALILGLVLAGGVIWLARWLVRQDAFYDFIDWLGGSGGTRRRQPPGTGHLPDLWLSYVRRNVHAYRRLTPEEQRRLCADTAEFVARKNWEGCAGLQMTDEIKVTVAAQACLLLLGMEDHDLFRGVESILVYPAGYRTLHGEGGSGGIVGETAVLGEAWYRGPVTLAWDQVLAGGRGQSRGNLVYHEFAHQLDFQGEPVGRLRRHREQWGHWQKVLTGEYNALVEAAKSGAPTLLDKYGATNPAEFFAVATECFFTRPVEMAETHAELYGVLREYYGQDTAERARR